MLMRAGSSIGSAGSVWFPRCQSPMSASQETVVLLHRWCGGDHQALDRLLEQDRDWMRAFVRRRMGDGLRRRCESVDLVQEGALHVLRGTPRFVPENRVQFRAYLAEVLLNIVHSRRAAEHAQKRDVRRDSKLPSTQAALPASTPTPDDQMARDELCAWVQLALELLPEADAELVRWRQFDELSYDEIGRRLGRSADAARMRFQRVLPQLTVLVHRLRGLADRRVDELRAEESPP